VAVRWAPGARAVVMWRLGEVAAAWQCGGPVALTWW
jgi:hypothetical protein